MPQLQPWPLMLSIAILRVALVLGGFFVLVPRLLLPDFPDRGSAGIAGRFCIFAFIEVAAAHLLAPLRLYEGLTILGVLVLALLWRFYFSLPADRRFELDRRLIMQSMDLIDRLTGDRRVRKQEPEEAQPAGPIVRRTPLRWADLAVLAVVVAVAAWLRYDQGFRHVTPAFPDAPVTIEWTKQFGSSDSKLSGMELIYAPRETGSIYPRGMYAFLTFLRKFTGQSVYLTMVAFGPMMNLITVLTVAGVLRWSTGSTLAGAIGALVYGTLLKLSPSDVARYAGYNSQEFAMIFCLPAAWFSFRYLVDGKPGYLLAAALGAGVIMFTHLIPTWFVTCLMAAAVITAVLARKTSFRRVAALVGACALAGLIAVAPLAVAALTTDLKFYSDSVGFLTSAKTSSSWLPASLPPLWYLALLGVPALLAPLLAREGRAGVFYTLMAVLAAAFAWIAPVSLQNIRLPGFSAFSAIATRGGEAGAISLGLAAGLSWFTVERILGRLIAWPVLPALLCAATVGAAWWLSPPAPLVPIRVSTDEEMTQLIRLDAFWRENDWTVVSGDANYVVPDKDPLPGWTTLRVNIGYSMALGRGYHLYPQSFVRDARMGEKGWCSQEGGTLTVQTHNIALFLDDRFPESKRLLQDWMADHKDLPWSEIYASPTLQIWTIQYKPVPEDQVKAIWGEEGMTCGAILKNPR